MATLKANPLSIGIRQAQNDRAQLRTFERSYGGQDRCEMLTTENSQNNMNGLPRRTNNLTGFRVDWHLYERADGSYLITIQDSGTTGYTGQLYDSEEDLYRLTNVPSLPSTDKLLRMNAMYQSGGNAGGGTEGQGGKSINLLMSNYRVVYDSLRSDDGMYVAFSHFYEGIQRRSSLLTQSIDDVRSLVEFDRLPEIKTAGARVILPEPDAELVEAMKNCFKPENSDAYATSIAYFLKRNFLVAIEAGAEYVIHDAAGNSKTLSLDPFDMRVLQQIPDATYDHEVEVTTPDGKHKAHLRVTRLSDAMLKTYKNRRLGVRCYRAMQDVGVFGLMANRWNDAVKDGVVGVITFDHELEQLILHFEHANHTSINFRPNNRTAALTKAQVNYVVTIGQLLTRELEVWQNKFDEERGDKTEDMQELTSQLNSILRQLNICQSQNNKSKPQEPFTISIEKAASLYLDGQTIPNLPLLINNSTTSEATGQITLALVQGDKEIVKWQGQRKLTRGFNSYTVMPVTGYVMSKANFTPGEFRVKATLKVGEKTYPPVHSILYFEDGPPGAKITPVSLLCPELAIVKEGGSRYPDDTIPVHTATMISRHPNDLKVTVRSYLLREPTRSGSPRTVLHTQEHQVTLRAYETMSELFGSIALTETLMKDVLLSPALPEERKCSMRVEVVLRDYDADLNLGRGDILASRSFPFYFGVEPPGDGMFVAIRKIATDDAHPKRRVAFWSEYSVDDKGYVLYVNTSFMLIKRLEENMGPNSMESNLYINRGLIREALLLHWKNGAFTDYAEQLGQRIHDEDADVIDTIELANATIDHFCSIGEDMYLRQFSRTATRRA